MKRRPPVSLSWLLGPIGRTLPHVGLVAAFAFAVIANVLAVRHYSRWDLTTARQHTLSAATRETLRGLSEPVEVTVLLGAGEALRESLRHALEAYRAETDRLAIEFVDPDKDPGRFEEVRRRYRLEAGRSEAGRAVENVAVIVARGGRHWFVERGDLLEIESVAEARVKPREERALTAAIRAVLSGEKPRLCFTVGHGEPSLDDFGPRGLGGLAEVLRKDNYDLVELDTTAPTAHAAFDGCRVVVVSTPRRPWSREEDERLRLYLVGGGSALVAVSPIAGPDGFIAPGLSLSLGAFGVELSEALVVETDPRLYFPETRGTRFIAGVRPHPVTASLAAEGPGLAPPPVVVELVRPLARASGGDPGGAPVELLSTSDDAFGVVHVTERTEWSAPPTRSREDRAGPLTLAMASERAPADAASPHGPRLVVAGTSSVLTSRPATEPLAIGGNFFAEGAISWLAARPLILDIPDRPAVTAGVRLTAESLAEVKRYVLALIPLTFAALGVLVTWSRRRSPGKSGSSRRPSSAA